MRRSLTNRAIVEWPRNSKRMCITWLNFGEILTAAKIRCSLIFRVKFRENCTCPSSGGLDVEWRPTDSIWSSSIEPHVDQKRFQWFDGVVFFTCRFWVTSNQPFKQAFKSRIRSEFLCGLMTEIDTMLQHLQLQNFASLLFFVLVLTIPGAKWREYLCEEDWFWLLARKYPTT